MASPAVASFRCPDCGKSVGPLDTSRTCGGCARAFGPTAGVWDLLPSTLDAVKVNEDRAHEDEGLPTWRRLFFHKRHWLSWCESRWLPTLLDAGARRVLEVGGGLCYASALAKQRAPDAWVVASDVSARYLRQHAVRVGSIIGTPADAYAAVDAEQLPFDDGQFDAVYSQVVLYRLPDPSRALREIRRVLAPGGRYLGVERASPWLPAFLVREAREMGERSAHAGLSERPLRWRDWLVILDAAGIERTALAPVPGHRVRSPALRRLGNAVRPIHVTIQFSA